VKKRLMFVAAAIVAIAFAAAPAGAIFGCPGCMRCGPGGYDFPACENVGNSEDGMTDCWTFHLYGSSYCVTSGNYCECIIVRG
jgi:hypothetical protein